MYGNYDVPSTPHNETTEKKSRFKRTKTPKDPTKSGKPWWLKLIGIVVLCAALTFGFEMLKAQGAKYIGDKVQIASSIVIGILLTLMIIMPLMRRAKRKAENNISQNVTNSYVENSAMIGSYTDMTATGLGPGFGQPQPGNQYGSPHSPYGQAQPGGQYGQPPQHPYNR